jgi:hypothetical protein
MDKILELCMIIYFIIGSWLFLKVIYNFKKICMYKCNCSESKKQDEYVTNDKTFTSAIEPTMPDIRATIKGVNIKSEEVKPTKKRK